MVVKKVKSNGKTRISVNGKLDNKSKVNHGMCSEEIELFDPTVITEILNHTISEIEKKCESLILNISPDWYSGEVKLEIVSDFGDQNKGSKTKRFLIIEFYHISNKWNYPFSMDELSLFLQDYINNLSDPDILFHNGSNGHGFSLEFNVESGDGRLEYYDNPLGLIEKQFLEFTERKNSEPEVFFGHFDIPKNVRTVCLQYLIYFSEFLRDLAIDNSSEVREESDRILFKIKPTDKTTALSDIAELLRIYLLAVQGEIEMSNIEKSSIDYFPVTKWEAAARALHDQLTVKKAELEFKNATIQMLQTQVQNQLLITENKGNIEDSEEVIRGILDIGEKKVGPLNINFAELYRRAKKKLWGDK